MDEEILSWLREDKWLRHALEEELKLAEEYVRKRQNGGTASPSDGSSGETSIR
jgi:hypothetical protein